MTLRRRRAWLYVLALCAGVVGAFGQAPYDQPLAMILALAIGFATWSNAPTRRSAAVVGWAFGTGYFALSLAWIVEPFQVDAARHGWMAPFALLFLSSGLALFWAAAFWAARVLSHRMLALVFAWTGAEIMRAYVFTGFPWAGPAQVMTDGPVSRLLAFAGPHGATFCLMLLASVLALKTTGPGIWKLRFGKAALAAAAGFSFYLPLAYPAAQETGQQVRLIQPNAAQHLKWQPEYAELFFQRQLVLTASAPASPQDAPDLVVWPETAIPWRLEAAGPALAEIARAGGSATVALGALRSDGTYLRNALAVIDAEGAVAAVYDKHHLVPFGEYIPLAAVARRLGIRGMVEQTVGFAPGPGQQLLDFGGLGRALPLICYEAVFAHGVGAAPSRPDFLLQVTNDAWFGTYAGPQQHLAQARMRAIEQGLPFLRAANTGISAAIDPYGRITSALPLGTAGFLDVSLPAPLPPTIYSRTGDTPVILLVLMGLCVFLLHAWRASRQKQIDPAEPDT